jgi:tripartite motif-containing protein 56
MIPALEWVLAGETLPSATEDAPYHHRLVAPEGAEVTGWRAANLPPWLTLASLSGELTGTPREGDIGQTTIDITALASGGRSRTAAYTLRVESRIQFAGHTFTTCGRTGPIGPTLTHCKSAYGSGVEWVSDANQYKVTKGIQWWTVPATGRYRIEAAGAGFGSYSAQRGARMRGDFDLVAGEKLKIVVGQRATGKAAGSGGSFVAKANNTPLLVAGGSGGGHANHSRLQGTLKQLAEPPLSGASNTEIGNGGRCNGCNGRGGGGFYGDAQGGEGGKAFVNGAEGGHLGQAHEGGFGGGGSRNSTSTSRAGGGGGYSGGNGSTGTNAIASGGGSFNAGTNQSNQAGANNGQGYVKISLL